MTTGNKGAKSFNLGQRKRRPAGPNPDFYASGPLRLSRLSFHLLHRYASMVIPSQH